MQLSFKVPVQPGEELTVCKNFAVPEGTFDIGKFEHAMTGPSHHLLVYALSTPAADVTDDLIYACDEKPENQMLRTGFVYGTQSATSNLALPEGITGDNCEATFKDGVLEVTIPMPKQAERAAKKVQIR